MEDILGLEQGQIWIITEPFPLLRYHDEKEKGLTDVVEIAISLLLALDAYRVVSL